MTIYLVWRCHDDNEELVEGYLKRESAEAYKKQMYENYSLHHKIKEFQVNDN